ncbi:MAG: beta-galactosidase [Armatimonadetes bacterium]|nr:beta-galactosidase [Armatimonadota bacterium]
MLARCSCLASLLTLLLATPLLARHDGAYLRDVTTKLETPHLTWGKPYARGKLKVLAIVPRTVAPREIVELWQRFDIDFSAFTLAHSGLMSFESDAGAAPYDLAVEGTSIEEKTAELLAKLEQPYDGFILANAALDALPTEAQYKLLRRVADGAGLLFVFGRSTRLPLFKHPLPDGRETIFAGVPLAGLSYLQQPATLQALGARTAADLPARLVETFGFYQGRLAVINWGQGSGTYYGGHGLTPPEPYSLQWPAHYEAYLSLVAKALLWTMPAKQPAVTWAELPADGTVLQRGSLAAKVPLRLVASGALKGKLEVAWRDDENLTETRTTVPLDLPAGESSVSLDVPVLKAGGHYLDLLVRSKAGIEQWGSIHLVVESPLTLAKCGTEREFYEAGEPAVVAAELSSPAPAGARLRVTCTDTTGRLYARAETALEPGATAAKLTVSLAGSRTIATRLHAALLAGVQVVDVADSFVFVPRRETDQFRTVLWGGVGCGGSGLGWLAYQQLRRAGFNAILSHPSPDGSQERMLALCDFPLVSYSYRVMLDADENGWRHDGWVRDVADGTLYNPELRQKAIDACVGRTRTAIPFGPLLYSLGDENYLNEDGVQSPSSRAAFAKYLQARYGTIEALNQRWGSTYADWAQIEPLRLNHALKQELWPLAHEELSFQEQEYADYHHMLADALRQADPHARVGAEGSVPGDLERTLEGLDIWGPYSDKLGNELLRSLAKPDLVRGNWWGGYVGSHGGRTSAMPLWRQLLGGAVNTSLYFAAVGSEGLFAGDLSYAGFFEQTLPDLRVIYGGLGQLISTASVPDDGIAVLWSTASEHSARMFAALGTPAAAQTNLLAGLDRLGLGYRFVTSRQVAAGGLKGVRVLLLAGSQALGDGEAQAIEAFVRDGGTLVADQSPGLLTADCRPRWKADPDHWSAGLDALFGLQRHGEPRVQAANGNLQGDWQGRALQLRDLPFRCDASLVDAAGAALGKVGDRPVCLARELGRGRTLLLGFPFPSAEHPDTAPFLRELLAGVGVRPAAWLSPAQGYSYRRFQLGDLTLLGVVREAATARDTTLHLATPSALWDTLAGKPLGLRAEVPLPKAGPAVRVFAVLPSAEQRLSVVAPATVARGAALRLTLSLTARQGGTDGRILRVALLRPDGTEATPYRSYPTVRGGKAVLSLPTALNDPPGGWTVTATDVATGTTARATFRLVTPQRDL